MGPDWLVASGGVHDFGENMPPVRFPYMVPPKPLHVRVWEAKRYFEYYMGGKARVRLEHGMKPASWSHFLPLLLPYPFVPCENILLQPLDPCSPPTTVGDLRLEIAARISLWGDPAYEPTDPPISGSFRRSHGLGRPCGRSPAAANSFARNR